MFRASQISLDQILSRSDGKRLFSNQLIIDYLLKDSSLQAYYKYEANLKSFEQVIADKGKETIERPVLVKVLEEQYAKIDDAPGNIGLLEEANTYTITTGHQICLFTGPLYFIFKIITTINLVEQLKEQYPDKNFVPIYWMATEDHDFEEINHAHVFSKKLVWDDVQDGPVGTYDTKSMGSVLSEMSDLLGNDKSGKELGDLFTASYAKHENLADATRYLVHQLFGKHGLVVLDPSDGRLKRQFVDIMKDDLVNHGAFNKMSITSDELRKKYKLLVNPREVNLFYINERKRERIDMDAVNYKIGERSISKEELLGELASNPEKFSPNVMLRTIYQEKILPNLAYVGGPGEIAYWLQFKGVFDNYGINFPMLVLRNSAFIISKNLSTKMEKVGITAENLFLSTDELVEHFVSSADVEEAGLSSELSQIEGLYEKLKVAVAVIDKSLVDAVAAEEQKTKTGLENIEKKILKAQKLKHEVSIKQIENVKSKLFPGNSLQERHDNISQFLALFGIGLIDQLIEHLVPLTDGVTVLEEN